jgi:hypothetical protein
MVQEKQKSLKRSSQKAQVELPTARKPSKVKDFSKLPKKLTQNPPHLPKFSAFSTFLSSHQKKKQKRKNR